MEIQRQSDYYGIDRPEPRQAHLTVDQIAAFTRGLQITPGLLNTRTASDPNGFYEPSYTEGGPAFPSAGMAVDALESHALNGIVDVIGPGVSMTGDAFTDTTSFNPGPMAPGKTGSDHRVRHELLQAEGEEIEGIGLYQDFLDDAMEAGDEQAAGVIGEALHDELDHAHNFADVLREGRQHLAGPSCTCGHPVDSHDGNPNLCCDHCPCSGLTVRTHSPGRN